MYNPIKQGIDQDPNATFIRKWVPELGHLQLPKYIKLAPKILMQLILKHITLDLPDLAKAGRELEKYGQSEDCMVSKATKQIVKTW